jgi:hypothetical protein
MCANAIGFANTSTRSATHSGSERSTAPVYVKFVAAVRLAQAEARAVAEVTVRKMDPKWWLSRMHRDRTGTPGWTDKQQLEHTGEEASPLVFKIMSYKD